MNSSVKNVDLRTLSRGTMLDEIRILVLHRNTQIRAKLHSGLSMNSSVKKTELRALSRLKLLNKECT